MQTVVRQDLVDEMEHVVAAESTEQVIVQPVGSVIEGAATLPHLARPEDRRLRQIVATPNLENAAVVLEGARMLHPDEVARLVDETAASH